MKKKNIRILIFLLLVFITVSWYCFSQEVYDSQGRPDPFIPWVTDDGRLQILVAQPRQDKSENRLKLEGIMYDKRGLSYAIINGEIVKVADVIDGYCVLRIEEKKVVLIKAGQPQEIILEEEGL
ncbi:MAG: hypothetical protein N2606_03130 [Candidatus Omnitrophica bacterium]|nr:hypothetical protein [Candidatus Omnitrophota bacterium]